jgi:hypothetical protein
VAESDGLENRCVARHRGFESHSLRQTRLTPWVDRAWTLSGPVTTPVRGA